MTVRVIKPRSGQWGSTATVAVDAKNDEVDLPKITRDDSLTGKPPL